MKDFVLFYAIGLFTLFLELYNKISSIDGTSEHKYHYLGEKESDKNENRDKNDESKSRIK